jgi:hypothetical protein
VREIELAEDKNEHLICSGLFDQAFSVTHYIALVGSLF